MKKNTSKISLLSALLRKRKSSVSSKQASRHMGSWRERLRRHVSGERDRDAMQGSQLCSHQKHLSDRTEENPADPSLPKVHFPGLALAARPCLTPPLHWGARLLGGTGAAPAPGAGLLPGDRPRPGWDVGPLQQGPGPGRAVGSWRWALLWHHWGRGCRSPRADMGSWA